MILQDLLSESLEVKWLLISPSERKIFGLRTPENLTISSACAVTIAMLNCFPVIPLLQIKSLHNKMNKRQIAGYWSSNSGLKLSPDIDETYNLNGAVMNVTAVVSIINYNYLKNRVTIQQN